MLKQKIAKKFFANIQFVYMGYLCNKRSWERLTVFVKGEDEICNTKTDNL